MSKIKMHTFNTIDGRDSDKRQPGVVDGRITTEAKIPLLVLNFQAGRCVTCGSPGCLQGAGADQQGCPFGRPIPDIHKNEAQAEDVLTKALDVLKILNPAEAEKLLAATQDMQDPQLPFKRARFPLEVFRALEDAQFAYAGEWRASFNSHMRTAFDISNQKGPMGDIYGRICPASLCENACTTHHSGHGSITIRMNEAVLWDYAWESEWLKPIVPAEEKPQTIVVIGSGFAGYAAAERSRMNGYQVVMVERNEEPGEPGNDQILGYKTVQERFRRHYQRLENSGVQIFTSMTVGRDGLAITELRDRFNASAIVFATGTPKPRDHGLSGDAAPQVLNWNDYTGRQQWLDRTQASNDDLPPQANARGKTVAIIGTGDTAVDCARTAALQGAKEVIMISRHDRVKAADMNAWNAMEKEAGVQRTDFKIQNWMNPQNVSQAAGGQGFILKGTYGGNQSGDSAEIELRADMVIAAIGNEAGNLRETFNLETLPVTKNGLLNPAPVPFKIADKTLINGIGAGYLGKLGDTDLLAAGQCVRGDSLAAICGRDGVDIARWIDEEFTKNAAAPFV